MTGQRGSKEIRLARPRQVSRRALLKGALGVGVALPWLEVMMPRSSRAQAATSPLRFGVFFSPCGTIPENWRPTALNPTVATPSATSPAVSTDFTLSRMLKPLEPFQNDIVVLRGVSMESTNGKYGPIANVHDQGMTHMLTATGLVKGPAGAGRANHFLDGSAGGPSIDQHIAQAIGGQTLLPSIELGVESTDTFLETLVTHMIYGSVDPNDPYKRAAQIPPVDDPVQIYTRLFGTAQQGSQAQVVAALKNRQSVLDYVVSDYGDLMGKVGSQDRAKLDQHLTNIRDIEGRLTKLINNPGAYTCSGAGDITPVSPARQKCLRDQDLRTPAELMNQAPNYCVTNYVEIGKLQMDLMILAFACDITRVASMQWSTAESTVIHTWLPDFGLPALQYAGTKEHHMLTHNETAGVSVMASKVDSATAAGIREDLTNVGIWYAMQFAYMVGKLKGIQEANGKSLLDNMLLFWTNELGVGGTHAYTNVPYVLAGSAGGQLQTGRYIDFWGEDPARPTGVDPTIPYDFGNVYGKGAPHNKLFVSMLKMFGINENTFGIPDFAGPLPGL
jgi:hypothetical protein